MQVQKLKKCFKTFMLDVRSKVKKLKDMSLNLYLGEQNWCVGLSLVSRLVK